MQAMILAAGRGERMRPLTDTVPKPLLCVGGKPLIVWHIERLVAAGIVNIVINHAWLGDHLEAALGNGQRYGAYLRYSREAPALETAGGIAQALAQRSDRSDEWEQSDKWEQPDGWKQSTQQPTHARKSIRKIGQPFPSTQPSTQPWLGPGPFLVLNGDVWCDWDPAQAHALATTLDGKIFQAWLLLVKNPAHSPDGDFYLGADQTLTPFGKTRLTFSGIGLYHPRFFDSVMPGTIAPLAPLLHRAIQDGKVRGEYYPGQWRDVGTPQRLTALNALIAHKRLSE